MLELTEMGALIATLVLIGVSFYCGVRGAALLLGRRAGRSPRDVVYGLCLVGLWLAGFWVVSRVLQNIH